MNLKSMGKKVKASHIMHGSIHMKFPEQADPCSQQGDEQLDARALRKSGGKTTANGHGGDKNVLKLDCRDSCTTL